MSESNLGDIMMNDIIKYTNEINAESKKIVKGIAKEMQQKITADTPVRNYPDVVRYKVVNRIERAKAVKAIAADNKQPGSLKKGWKIKTLRNTDDSLVQGICNKNNPYIIAPLDFGHVAKAHGKTASGTVQGTYFASKVQKWANEQLKKRIDDLLK